MADACIFCGKGLSFLSDNALICGGVSQPVCGRCADRYITLPLRQRAKLALDTGRAQEPERIQEYLDKLDAKLAMEAQRREYQEKTLLCCGRKMEKIDEGAIHLQRNLFQGFTNLLGIFRCECCGQIKFFDSSFLTYTPQEEEVPIPEEKPNASRFKSGKKPPWEK